MPVNHFVDRVRVVLLYCCGTRPAMMFFASLHLWRGPDSRGSESSESSLCLGVLRALRSWGVVLGLRPRAPGLSGTRGRALGAIRTQEE